METIQGRKIRYSKLILQNRSHATLYDFGGVGLEGGEAGEGEVGPGLAFGLAFVNEPKSL